MADIKDIFKKLRGKGSITDEDLLDLQVHVDVLERLAQRAKTHHDTTHHHTSALALGEEHE
jgi:hypothetical protein